MADRKSGARAAGTRAANPGADWYGRDISDQVHSGVVFVDADLTEVTNRGAVFTECAFTRARFNVSVHSDAAFVNCTFTRCSFSGGDILFQKSVACVKWSPKLGLSKRP